MVDSQETTEQLQAPTQLPMTDGDISEVDPEMAALLAEERQRQVQGIELIASENFTSKAVMQVLGSCLTNKYSEGYPGRRYYGGNEVIDKIELLCQKRALEAFRLDPEQWGVNVQPLSGSPANFAVYTGLLEPGSRLMGLSLAHGGHLTHGHQTETKKISASSHYFVSQPYYVNEETGLIDMDALEAAVQEFRPNILLCGASGYPRDFDYARYRQIADGVGAYLMADIAHISGLVATQQMANPFDHCDIVTSTTHKSLRGPRSGVIFVKKELLERVNFAVFPMLQGGPHNHQIGALAVQLKQVATPAFTEYCQQVIANARAVAAALKEAGEKIITDGTDTHLVMWDVRPHGLTGSKVDKVLDCMHVTTNKNSVVGDRSAINPGGIRIGTPAMTTRGMKEPEMRRIVHFLLKSVAIAVRIQQTAGKKLAEFNPVVEVDAEVAALKEEVHAFASQYPMPGI